MVRLRALRGWKLAALYAVAAPALLLSQHLAVALAYRARGAALLADAGFWLLPLRRLAELPGLSPTVAASVFCLSLATSWILALLSFKRAAGSELGFGAAIFTIVPVFQMAAVALLTVLPWSFVGVDPSAAEDEPPAGAEVAHVVQGVLAGMTIIVAAVLVSALTFGAYGWGLFVLTPLLVGITTGYLANRKADIGFGATNVLVIGAAALGGFALLMMALEGLACIVLIAPLAAVMAMTGGVMGRGAAISFHGHGRPLACIALLPAVFALEGAMPPAAPIESQDSIDIAAPAAAVWGAVTSDEAIAPPPGLISRAGLAYPLRGRLLGSGVGAVRLGYFSTGTARERVTEWVPGRKLAFAVVSQPPSMEEMSPYRRVHAPHVNGYFDTGETTFELQPLAGGGTRLTVRASHVLRIDPVLYWEPLARWAIRQNFRRVLTDLKQKAERAPSA